MKWRQAGRITEQGIYQLLAYQPVSIFPATSEPVPASVSDSAFVFLFCPLPDSHKEALKTGEREIVRRWSAEGAHYQKHRAVEAPVKLPGWRRGRAEVVFPLDPGHHYGQLLNVLDRFVFSYF